MTANTVQIKIYDTLHKRFLQPDDYLKDQVFISCNGTLLQYELHYDTDEIYGMDGADSERYQLQIIVDGNDILKNKSQS
jgi:hypothetical protein